MHQLKLTVFVSLIIASFAAGCTLNADIDAPIDARTLNDENNGADPDNPDNPNNENANHEPGECNGIFELLVQADDDQTRVVLEEAYADCIGGGNNQAPDPCEQIIDGVETYGLSIDELWMMCGQGNDPNVDEVCYLLADYQQCVEGFDGGNNAYDHCRDFEADPNMPEDELRQVFPECFDDFDCDNLDPNMSPDELAQCQNGGQSQCDHLIQQNAPQEDIDACLTGNEQAPDCDDLLHQNAPQEDIDACLNGTNDPGQDPNDPDGN